MRLFTALALPEEVREELSAICSGVPGARWIPPENMHLTLRFIGEVDNALARDIDDMLLGLTGKGFELTLSGVDVFTDGPRITSLWAGVEANEALNRLQGKVEQAVIRAGLPPERRKFKPHVTLARGRIENGRKLQQFMSHNALLKIGPFRVEDFVLFSSFLSQSGPLYTEEASYPLEPVYAQMPMR